jgi:hypothetical protein
LQRPTAAGGAWHGRYGAIIEGICAALTLVVGGGGILAIGFGLLGPTPANWLDFPAILTIWLPLMSVLALGIGALLNALGRPSAVAGWRWLFLCGLAFPTLVLLIVSPAGIAMIPIFVMAYVTAAVSQLRARFGGAPSSRVGVLLGAIATVAFVVVIVLLGRHALLLLSA